MSKKTRKNSPKTPAGKPALAKSEGKTKKASKNPSKSPSKNPTKNKPDNKARKAASPLAKTTAAKTRKPTAKKSVKGASKKSGEARAKASHKAPTKPLKPSGLNESVARTAAASDAPAAKSPVPKPGIDPASAKAGAAAPRQLGLNEGAKAPAFQLPRDGGDSVSLSDFKGRKLVLFFYPRADTPGCTKEAIDFSRLSATFAENQTAVLGVSADPPKAQEAFRDKHELVTPLVSDEQHEMLDAYGVWGEKSMYGRTFQGILRTTVLIGADGRILRIWRNVKVDGHADEVLAAVRAL